MMTNGKIGVALVGGYLLGRTKKAKMAIGLGMFLAGKKLSLDPKQLGQLVSNSPVLGSLNSQVRKELVDATKSAAVSAATNRMSGLADSLSERTRDLDDPDRGKGREERYDDEADDDSAADEDDARDAAEDRDEEPAPRRRAAAKAPAKTATKTAKSSGGKAASGAGRAASGAKGATSASRKSTSSAKKATSGAGKTATKATRAASNRGGRNA
jgi:hypothetical protein